MPSPPAYTILRRQQSVSDSEKPTTTSFISSSSTATSSLTHSKIKISRRHHSSTTSSSKENRSRSDVSHNNNKNNKSSKNQHNRQQESFSSLKTDSSDESDVNTHLKSVSPVISANNNIHHSNRHQASIFSLNSVLEETVNIDNSSRNVNKHARSKSSYDKPNTKELRRPHSDYYPSLNNSSSIQESNKLTVTHYSDNDESRSKLSKPYSRRPSFSGSPSKLDSKKLYAGPTFNNSPDPSALPIPSFLGGKSLTKDSPLSTYNNDSTTIITNNDTNSVAKHSPQILIDSGFSSGNSSDDDMFVMDDIHSGHKYQSNAFLNLLGKETLLSSKRQQQQYQTSAAAYMIPERMATSHHPSQVYSVVDELSLDDISKALKSILKIGGQ